MRKTGVLLLGKIPPPFMGPAIATQILLRSSLRERYRLMHLDTRANRTLHTMGRWSVQKVFRTLFIYLKLFAILLFRWPSVVIIPISQSTTGYIKDFFYILLSRLFFRKVVVHLRGSNFRNWYNGASGITRWFIRTSLRWTQGVIVLGHNLRPLFSGIFSEEKIFVVPNGANYPFSGMLTEKTPGVPVRLLYLANLQSSKGIEDLLEAVLLLKKQGIAGFRLDVVGEWRSDETKRICVNLVKNHELPVEFYPAASGNTKFNYLEQADVFVFTPREPEGHPWVIVEALAAGLPVVSTDQGAIVESVRDGLNGFIVEARCPDQIASRLADLINDSAKRQRFSAASRKHYETNFTEEIMVERLSRVIETVTGN